jgi:hypothetical protein
MLDSLKAFISENRYMVGLGTIVFLVVANIINYLIFDWGLITIHAKNEPLGQVVKSIERQGWVTVYTDMDPTTPVNMDVDDVPLAEAMETLSANVDRPPRDNSTASSSGDNSAPAGTAPRTHHFGPPGDFGGGGAHWELAFFAAPTSAQVKQEISAFQSGNVGDGIVTYEYPTSLSMLAGSDPDSDLPASDPRRQSWPGLQTPPPPAAPAANASQDGQADPPPAPPAPPTSITDYLKAIAEQSNVWIMAPAAWDHHATAPGPRSSIISAIKSLVSSAGGAVEEAIILRGGHYTHGDDHRHGFSDQDTAWMEDRERSAIEGLPAEDQPAALESLRAAPQDQRMSMMLNHFKDRAGRNFWRQSPQKRAQRYQQAVANRQAARGA